MNKEIDTIDRMLVGSGLENDNGLSFEDSQMTYSQIIKENLLKSKLLLSTTEESSAARESEFILSKDGSVLYKIDIVKSAAVISELNIILARIVLVKGPADATIANTNDNNNKDEFCFCALKESDRLFFFTSNLKIL